MERSSSGAVLKTYIDPPMYDFEVPQWQKWLQLVLITRRKPIKF